jgi:hypothetical protein
MTRAKRQQSVHALRRRGARQIQGVHRRICLRLPGHALSLGTRCVGMSRHCLRRWLTTRLPGDCEGCCGRRGGGLFRPPQPHLPLDGASDYVLIIGYPVACLRLGHSSHDSAGGGMGPAVCRERRKALDSRQRPTSFPEGLPLVGFMSRNRLALSGLSMNTPPPPLP